MSEGCRDHCLDAGEPLAGSAGSAGIFVAIAWPRRLWHADKAARSEGLPGELAELEARIKGEGGELALRVFQRAPGGETERVEVLVFRSRAEGYRLPDVELSLLPRVVEAACGVGAQGLDGLAREPLGPELLVCTDGQHDACCARFGRPVYRALCDEAARTSSPVQVSECSHLGGHRFAGNALALPGGELYGRLEVRDVAPLLRAQQSGRPLRYRLRGRLGQSEALQAAEALLAARLPDPEAFTLEDPEAEPGALELEVRGSARGSGRHVVVHCRREAFAGPGSCGGPSETRERWVAVELRES